LMEMVLSNAPALLVAARFVMIPDLINYWLTGRIAVEYTNASTTHLLNACKKDWDLDLIHAMGIPDALFPGIVKPGTILERLVSSVSMDTNLPRIPVIATASHDTAAAIASVPASGSPFAYLSSGTWGLLGSEIANPNLGDDVYKFGFVNQGGVEDRFRLLHNSLNMWLLQECRRIWSQEGIDCSWEVLISMASQAEEFTAFIDTDDPALLLPINMPREIQRLCQTSNQAIPQSKGQILRVILESLAFKNRWLFDRLTGILKVRPNTLHIVGGGARNRLLNQFLADALDVPVVAGPFEATAIGNILVQMIADGELHNLDEGRALVRTSFPTERYEPSRPDVWEDNFMRFKRVAGLE